MNKMGQNVAKIATPKLAKAQGPKRMKDGNEGLLKSDSETNKLDTRV